MRRILRTVQTHPTLPLPNKTGANTEESLKMRFSGDEVQSEAAGGVTNR